MKHTIALLAALLLAPLVELNAADKPRPNILHIHADDHRADGLHALGNPLLVTPNLDTLVEQTPSLPDARPRSDRFRCGGRESNFLAVSQ